MLDKYECRNVVLPHILDRQMFCRTPTLKSPPKTVERQKAEKKTKQMKWYKEICAVTSAFVSRWRCRLLPIPMYICCVYAYGFLSQSMLLLLMLSCCCCLLIIWPYPFADVVKLSFSYLSKYCCVMCECNRVPLILTLIFLVPSRFMLCSLFIHSYIVLVYLTVHSL